MDSQYKLLSELQLNQAAFITSPEISLANYWGALPPAPPVSTGLLIATYLEYKSLACFFTRTTILCGMLVYLSFNGRFLELNKVVQRH